MGDANTPNDGFLFLWRSVIGQPVGGHTARIPGERTYKFGEVIFPATALSVDGTVVPALIDPPEGARFIPGLNRTVATSPGFVQIQWIRNDGSTNSPVRYYVENQPVQDPVALYHTHDSGGELSNNVGTIAWVPKVTIPAGLQVELLNNPALPDPTVVQFNAATREMRARNNAGFILLVYRDASANFLNLEVVDVRPNLPSGSATLADIGFQLSPYVVKTNAATHLADMDGDGRADLAHKAGDGSVFYFANLGTKSWGERQAMSVGFDPPPAPFSEPNVRTADLDFDKRTDLIRGDGLQYQIWFNLGSNQYSERITVPQDFAFDFANPAVQVADLNGDRVPDIARVWPTSVEVTMGLGYGRFTAPTNLPIPDATLDAGQLSRAKFIDITGDGLADLVVERAEAGELWYWINLGNHSFSPRKRITGLPGGLGPQTVVRWADLNGNGSTDLVYPYDSNGNMTNIDGLVCTWDFKDRLVAVENAEMRAAYTYDYTDRRILKLVWPKATNSIPSSNSHLPSSTIYVSKWFEVREHDAPTKYVWNGNTRVARVTGSLNTNVRVQRLRVHPGWNLCSLAVSSPSPLWGEGRGEVLSAAFRWNPSTQGWEAVALNASLPAGTVLWLQATTNATLAITGPYADPTNRTVTASGDFLPSAGLEAWNILATISNQPSTTLWTYDAPFTRWLSWLPPPLSTLNSQPSTNFPSFLAPGQAMFARADAPAQLEVPDSALRIRYYHQDHLGSSSCISDAEANPVQAEAHFPFGQPRNEFQPRGIQESYAYEQKERDSESGMHNFATRFLMGSLARFTRVDIIANEPPPQRLRNPQNLNYYAMCENNPVNKIDPTGMLSFGTYVEESADASLITLGTGVSESQYGGWFFDKGTAEQPEPEFSGYGPKDMPFAFGAQAGVEGGFWLSTANNPNELKKFDTSLVVDAEALFKVSFELSWGKDQGFSLSVGGGVGPPGFFVGIVQKTDLAESAEKLMEPNLKPISPVKQNTTTPTQSAASNPFFAVGASDQTVSGIAPIAPNNSQPGRFSISVNSILDPSIKQTKAP